MEYGTLFIVLGALGAFSMAFCNGANDVANAFASAVGSKALKMSTAVVVASFVTFLGALLLGGNVALKLVSGIVPPSTFNNPVEYIIGMIAVLVASAIFVFISTLTSLPVSSSHAIVGSLTGVTIIIAGFGGVQWKTLSTIAAAWVVSPVIAAVISMCLCWFIEKVIISNPPKVIRRVKTWLPIVVAFTICAGIYALFTLTSLRHKIGIDADHVFMKMSGLEMASRQNTCIDKIQYAVESVNYHADGIDRALFEGKESQVASNAMAITDLNDIINNEARHLYATATGRSPALFYVERWQVLLFCAVILIPLYLQFCYLIHGWLKDVPDTPEGAQEAFKNLQIGTSCYVSFAIGSNDVANSISPVLAIFLVVANNGIPESFGASMPIWLLLLGGLGMATGISILGYRVMRTLGENITKINNARGYCIDFATATSVVGASAWGLPVSTTHAATGSVVGSGLSHGVKNVKLGMLGKIIIGWLVTIPAAMLITMGVFLVLKSFFLR